jgi:hypothetical protein
VVPIAPELRPILQDLFDRAEVGVEAVVPRSGGGDEPGHSIDNAERGRFGPHACKKCGYDRHGLAADAACPECGTVPMGG